MAGLIPFNRRTALPMGFEDFYNVLDDFFTDGPGLRRNLTRDSFKLDVEESADAFTIHAELPGVKKEEIGLELNDNMLTISVKKEENADEEKKNYIHRERRITSMVRKIHLGDTRSDGIKARLEDGILTISIEKERKENRSIPINID
ncbi:MAG: Hsp20/alpha crystallin family protein [Synergistaceae bacterium]|jgi:HSP20 family protein|nr:Hsp20/alpha crystallin family protein [Synergistaceae bacterium]